MTEKINQANGAGYMHVMDIYTFSLLNAIKRFASYIFHLNLIHMLLKKEDLEKARQIAAFLETNYQESYGYDFLCKKFTINKFKLKMAFASVANDTIHAFLTKVRIQHAKRLLEKTDLNIGLIAVKVGLDKSNFNIQFKKHTGKTPSDWRKHPLANSKLYYEETVQSAKESKHYLNNSHR